MSDDDNNSGDSDFNVARLNYELVADSPGYSQSEAVDLQCPGLVIVMLIMMIGLDRLVMIHSGLLLTHQSPMISVMALDFQKETVKV